MVLSLTPLVTVLGGSSAYDALPHAATGSVTGEGGLDLGTPTFAYDDANDPIDVPTSSPPINVGIYNVTGSFAGDETYDPAAAMATIEITVTTPTVNVTGGSFPYDALSHAATGSVTGVGSEDLGAPTFTYDDASDPSDVPTSSAPINVGTYNVTASFVGGGNYGPASNTATIGITVATPTVNVTGGSFTYDALSHAATGSVTGVGSEDLGVPTFTYDDASDPSDVPTSSAPINVGMYNVTATYDGGGNYDPAANTATIEITVATPTVNVTGGIFTFDTLAHGATGSVTGVNGEPLGTPSITYDDANDPSDVPTSSAPINVGIYNVTASFAGGGNYGPAVGSGTIQIKWATALGHGYWKNHPEAWKVDSLTLGGYTYTKAELLGILSSSTSSDARVILARQVIAAKLNVLNYSDPAIQSTIDHADTLLSQAQRMTFHRGKPASLGAVKTSSGLGAQMVADAALLGAYNSV